MVFYELTLYSHWTMESQTLQSLMIHGKNMIDRHNMVSYIASDEISSLMSLNSDNCDVVYNRRWVLDTKIIDHILINNKSGGNIPGI
jgi:hypothetical protein